MKTGTSYDMVRIKDMLPPISELMGRHGHETRRVGTAMFMCCPFHEEKSPSCQIDDGSGRFHCFGCGRGGDVFDYWQHARGLSFRDSLAELAGIAGVGPEFQGQGRDYVKSAPKTKEPEKAPDPMTGQPLARWQAACDTLAADRQEIERIAQWRGIDPAAVSHAARLGLVGSYHYMGQRREAFLVEMPTPAGLMPVSVHIRLAPGSRGNEVSSKASWRFDPSKCGSWPFLIGDPSQADHLFLLEGQWDALALVSVMGWHLKEHWPRVAVIGLRGSTSGAKLLLHEINPAAQLFAIADADGAGARWFEEGGLLDKLHSRVRHLHAFWPTTEKHDLNDLVKSGELDRATLLSYLQPLMVMRPKPRPPTFTAWCKGHTADPDPVGRAARFVIHDKAKPKGRRPLRAWEGHWSKCQVPADLYADLSLLWQNYKSAC
jgi:hypothetical protein